MIANESLAQSAAFKAAIEMIISPTRRHRMAFVRAMEQADEAEFMVVGEALKEAFPESQETLTLILGTISVIRLQSIKEPTTMSESAGDAT